MGSRIARKPIQLPKGVEFSLVDQLITVKGPKGTLTHQLPTLVTIEQTESRIQCSAANDSKEANVYAGTTRALVQNMVTGVSDGYEIKLILKGVGYRAKVQGKKLELSLGFSHPVSYEIPEGITIECPSQTEISVKGTDKQQVGQVAAEVRAFRPPEPYKGKGVRYANEIVKMKETKKK